MPQLTAAQALVKSLVREGVEVVFGLPGVQIMDIYDAFHNEPGIRLITTRHEQGAAYMADGYARSTGKPGVCLVVPGPGLQNASAGIGTAYATSSPVMLIAGEVATGDRGKDRGATHEIIDQLDILKNVTKWRKTVFDAKDVPGSVHEAMRQMKTGRPRPVALEFPSDVLPKSSNVELMEREEFAKQKADPKLIKEAAQLLLKAKRPLIWAGGGVNASGANGELSQVAGSIGAVVITTAEGKGAVPENSAQWAGSFYYSHGPAHNVMPMCDVVLAVGTRLHFLAPTDWTFKPHQSIIHIDADPAELGRNWPEKVSIAADAKLALQALLSELKGKKSASEWTAKEIAQQKAKADDEVKQLAPNQVEIIKTIRQELPDDTVYISGIASLGYWSNLAYEVRAPRSYLNASYFATLGYAFPTALGAKVGNPNKPVVAVSGDGGFMYCLSELATAVQEGINVTVLVFNDQALGASLRDQQVRYKGRVIGTKLHTPDFAAVARDFGAGGVKLGHYRELGPALKQALKSNKTTVVEVPIESWTPPFQLQPPGAV
jgi:acetolactate synthase-1/2/3 large subunit